MTGISLAPDNVEQAVIFRRIKTTGLVKKFRYAPVGLFDRRLLESISPWIHLHEINRI